MEKYLFIVALLFPFVLIGQSISGTVSNEQGEALIGANVYWLSTNKGVSTGLEGEFNISTEGITSNYLIASYIGYQSDTLDISNQDMISFNLVSINTLNEVLVKGQRDGVSISDLNPIKTEQLNQVELGKAACCDLAGCFGTQTTVKAHTTNVITNSKELRILGLSGVYNQVLLDGLPMIQGLSYTYGISATPGTLVDNIFISKGANSVLQGYESISGQINVLTKDPDNTEKLLLNVYLNSFMEKQVNVNYAFTKNKWSNLTAVHSVQEANKIDGDGDNFLDLPLLTRYMVYNKWKYGNENEWGWNSRIGGRLLSEQRIGGQSHFDITEDKGSSSVYGQTVDIMQPELWTKTAYRFDDVQSITLFASGLYQDQNSFFGTVGYDAKQTSVYANIQHELDRDKINVKSGLSYRHLNLQEAISFSSNILERSYDGNYQRLENVPGAFIESTSSLLEDKLVFIIGIRADHHNQFGLKTTPRALVKYDLGPSTIARANIGTGWKTSNLFSENIGLLVSSRDIIFEEVLEPEEAINYGANLTQKFNNATENLSGFFSVDFYRTVFQNQIFPDYDTDPRKAIISNFRGTSISNGFQAELYLRILKRFEVKTGYNYLDVYRMIGEVKEDLPFNSKHRILTSVSFKPNSEKYHFDANLHWHGPQRLPNTSTNPLIYQRPDYSDSYTLLNAQFTYNFRKFEIYVGCENVFNFRQNKAIISWEDPFSPYFDTSSVWGPTRGRETYIGVRYKIASDQNL